MTAVKICLIVVLILWAAMLIRIGGIVEYSEDGLLLQVKIGPVRLTLYPVKREKKKKEKRPKPKKHPAKTGEQAAQEPPKRGGVGTLVKELLPLILETADRFRKKIRIAPLEALVTIPGGDDPAKNAILYGRVNGALGVLWPALNRAFDLRDGHIGTKIDFTETQFRVYIKAGVSLRIGQALWLGIRFGALGFAKIMSYRGKNRKAVSHSGK